MKITNEFTVPTPIDRAWAVLTDLEGIAPCLPGAHLTGVEGDTYSGKVKVKVGPVVSDFAGTARFVEKDDLTHRAVIDAKGRDSRSAGNAAAVVTAQLRADGDRTLVSVDTDLRISGKLAQFGSGMIKEVSGKLLGQFVTNLEAKLAAEEVPAGQGEPSSTAGTTTLSGIETPEGASLEGVDTPAEAATPAELAVPLIGTPAAGAGRASSGTHGATPGFATAGTGEPGGTHAPGRTDGATTPDEPEALDLLALAGGSVYKRAVPLGIGAAVVAAVIVWFVARR